MVFNFSVFSFDTVLVADSIFGGPNLSENEMESCHITMLILKYFKLYNHELKVIISIIYQLEGLISRSQFLLLGLQFYIGVDLKDS